MGTALLPPPSPGGVGAVGAAGGGDDGGSGLVFPSNWDLDKTRFAEDVAAAYDLWTVLAFDEPAATI